MMMGVEIVMQHFCKAAPLEFYPGIQRRSSDAILHTGFNVRRKKGHPQTVQYICHLKGPKTYRNIFTLWKAGAHSHGKATADRLDRSICRCQQAESVSEVACDDKNGAWFKELGNQASQYVDEVGNYNKLDTPPTSKYSSQKQRETLVEDEAWNLLKDSVAYYCGSPIGTIAANDPSDANVLNYDQVFIRDFIPSGIAFLLKGEYDIVRNFILHTLQLQASVGACSLFFFLWNWEKTMDCHSPGQGLMPASFKVRTVPLDGDGFATEEVLDPDFGESAIGRVAPVDSGLWWILLLRAYGKCSGDLSVQERIDVQTGIKMILKLCLADGFDMFPTLLVTDGSCMIDRRMGIHGHPLEIQVERYPEFYFTDHLQPPLSMFSFWVS
ncbi:hypothetical protein Taro_049779 [Colocasia esculenta]|uniref:Alkaline/neutral invertase n=1 Tax=Colocasia esculenta TaxID=4460 RepID=A0A843XBS0_COLES|nr:hypothetical protein [Colocasia esculenta]